MSNKAAPDKALFIEKIVDQARQRVEAGKTASIERFIRVYYANVPLDDIASADVDNLFAAAISLYDFARRREPGEALVRVFAPSIERHGWASSHSVVEMVNDDMPFLVDSILAELQRRDLPVSFVAHPILFVARDAEGRLTGLPESPESGTVRESMIHIEVGRLGPDQSPDEVIAGIRAVLANVRACVEDWPKMRERMAEVIETFPADGESKLFLEWLYDDRYTFLGYREYDFQSAGDAASLAVNPHTGLGVLRDSGMLALDELRSLADMPAEVRAFVERAEPLFVAKSNRPSLVHRPVYMDVLGLRRFDKEGRVIGLHIFVGLFTAVVYSDSPASIPMLRQKMDALLERTGFPPNSHDGRRLINILVNLPRDELFLASPDDLHRIAIGLLNLHNRPRVALFARRDEFERFASCLVMVPRDRYDTKLRLIIQSIVEEAFSGELQASHTQVTDAPHARLHIIIKTKPGTHAPVDVEAVEARLSEASRTWADRFHDALVAAKGEEAGLNLYRRYGECFPDGYRERFSPREAVFDAVMLDRLRGGEDIGTNLHRVIESGEVRLKIYHAGISITLSEVLPMLENMGFRVISEFPCRIRPKDGGIFWIHDFGLELSNGGEVDAERIGAAFQEAFARVWRGEMENDGFNRLVILARLSWREVVLLRSFAKYLRQAGIAYSQTYMEDALATNPEIAAMLVRLFMIRHDPTGNDDGMEIVKSAEAALESIVNADIDRILRRFLDVALCILRTNFFREGRDYISFKLDSRKLMDLPLPRPMAEIFVYSPRMEGIHLRGGKVARGGIRWSDRREDFRTEILGLMKAQMVKNAVIVPVGAKGGFILKHPPPASDREAFAKEGIACYRVLIKGLLDITDNLGPGGVIIPPEQVRRLDGDDPYLVVAADKGTATFSDIANEISLDYGFWLGDAFASGGSQGYDHKKMGITARGAWVAVKRHFRELGRDIGQEPFSVVGIGDMAGDVFGNGMLREKTIKLVGAFNHAHIFIDPHPDPAKSFAERERLFNLPRSQWSDYDASLISQGGGIWSRQAKSIPLSPEARALLGIEAESSPPEMLIKALLKAPVDLLWFGGIGNYVKAATESQAEANDRTNDSLRIDAKDLCAKVIGEGANMAVTQRGRVEFGLNGGRLNTDAIDNSAGVDASDHEVNIKILVNAVVADGDMTMKQRNSLLVEMTEEVGQLVLRDNFMQTQALSLIAADGVDGLDNQERLMRFLEKAGRLDRAIEFLPDGEQVAERLAARRGLTRPEIAVLLAYVKIWLFDEIQAGSLADDPALADELVRYFPTALQQNWRAAMDRHRLKREIVSTHIVNSLVNRMGLVFVHQLAEKTGQTPEAIARAWLTARAIFDLRSLWAEIEAAEPSMSSAALYAILGEINRMLERGTAWFLRNRSHPYSVVEVTAELAPGIVELEGSLEEALPAQRRGILEDQANRFVALGAPLELSRKVGRLVALASGPDIVTIARAREVGVTQAAKVYYAAGVRLSLGWMRFLVENLPVSTHWQKLASSALLDELYGLQRELAIKSLEAGLSLEDWLAGRGRGLERLEQLTAELRAAPHPDLAMLTVAARQIRGLLEG